jgi:hypothetical protein
MLRFPDGTKVSVNGLAEILADLHSQDRQADQETTEEIINRLEEKNHIPSAYLARKMYAYVLLEEFKRYLQGKEKIYSR